MHFNQLPVLYNERGSLRTAGFELEFANVDIEQSLRIIQDLYGGELKKKHRFSQEVINTSLGDFSVKIDLKLLNERSYQKLFNKLNINLEDVKLGDINLEYEVESALENIVRTVIPYEIVTPPVAITEVHQFERLRLALHQYKAEDTKSFLTNAFATHINIEVPSTSLVTLLNYMKAFLLLYPWLFRKNEVDLARRVTSFINPYPAKYADMIIDAQYQPDMDTFIEDYHQYNPDRNRPLDMYPLFAALRSDKVDQYSDLGNVKPRETFHYRLPNSLIENPDWPLARVWNHWVLVEELANDTDKIEQMSRDYLSVREDTLIGFENKWAKQTEKWL